MQHWVCFAGRGPPACRAAGLLRQLAGGCALRRRSARGVAEHFVTSPHQHSTGTIFYSEVGTWYGALTFAQLAHDAALRDRLIKKFEPLMPGGAEAALDSQSPSRRRRNLRRRASGDRHRIERAQSISTYGLSFADRQWDDPQLEGTPHESRYWIDDMYMLTILQLEAYRATGDRKYLDRDATKWCRTSTSFSSPTGSSTTRPMCHFLGPRRWMGTRRNDRNAARVCLKIIPSALAS